VNACENYPNTTNSAAEYGTAAHALAEMFFNGTATPEQRLGSVIEGVQVDQEMVDGVNDYIDYAQSFMGKYSVVIVEEKYDLGFISKGMFGTSDLTVITDDVLHIIDLKFGMGIVDAKDNYQLKLYALGAIEDLGTIYDFDKVVLHIAQPRAKHFDQWETSVSELYMWSTFVSSQAALTEQKDAPFNPSAKACQWCQHQANCETLKNHVNDIVTGSFDDLSELEGKADIIDNTHIKNILDNAELITGFVKAVQTVALERLKEGDTIPGYKLVESKTNRRWRDEAEVEAYLKKKRVKQDDMYVKKLIPMTQILKMRKGDKKLEEMLIKPTGQPQLAPDSDKRPVFMDVTDEFEAV